MFSRACFGFIDGTEPCLESHDLDQTTLPTSQNKGLERSSTNEPTDNSGVPIATELTPAGSSSWGRPRRLAASIEVGETAETDDDAGVEKSTQVPRGHRVESRTSSRSDRRAARSRTGIECHRSSSVAADIPAAVMGRSSATGLP